MEINIPLFCICDRRRAQNAPRLSMSFSNGANRDTELQVIVYQYWNADEVVAEIEAEHNQINGTPTTLTINLHRSKWSFHNGYEPFYSTTINYD